MRYGSFYSDVVQELFEKLRAEGRARWMRGTSGERCPPAHSCVPYSYLFSMCDDIIITDNYRRAQRAYTIGRPRIQKLSDKKPNNLLGELAFILSRCLFTHNSQMRISMFRGLFISQAWLFDVEFADRLDLQFYRRPRHTKWLSVLRKCAIYANYCTTRPSLSVASLTFRAFGKYSEDTLITSNVQAFRTSQKIQDW